MEGIIKKEQRQDLNSMIKISGFAGAGKLADIFFRYSTSVVLTRILGANIYGLFILGRTIIRIISTTGQMGMGLGVVREIPFHTAKNTEDKYQQAIRLSLLVCGSISIIATIILYWKVDYISDVLFKKPDLVLPLRLLIIAIPIVSTSYILLDVLRGFKKIKSRVLMEYYFLPLSNLFMIVMFYLLGYRLEGVIGAYILAHIFTLIVLIIINRGKIKIAASPFVEKRVASKFFKFSLPLMLVKILGELRNRLDILFLGFLTSASDVGIFFIASRLSNLISIPWQSFNITFAPMVSGDYALKEIKKIEYNYKNITKLIFLFGMFLWGFLLVFSSDLLSIFGSEFKKGALVVILICFGQVVKTLVGHAGPMLAMIGRSSLNLIITMITLVLLILLNLLLIPKFGINGAAVANVAAMIVSCLLELYFIYFFLKIHPFRKDFIKPAFSTLISASVIYPLKIILPANILITIFLVTAFSALYFITLYLQKLTGEEMVLLNKMKQKILIWREIEE